MSVTHADDIYRFQSEVIDSPVPVVVDFWAAWCGPCKAVAPELEALAAQYGDAVKIVKVDVDANPQVAATVRRPQHSHDRALRGR